MVTVNEIMVLERLLLEIEERFKFKMSLSDVSELYEHLKNVGKITNLFFGLQDNYYKRYKNSERLKKYHDRLINGKVKFETEGITEFIDAVASSFVDDEFYELVKKNKFWKSEGSHVIVDAINLDDE